MFYFIVSFIVAFIICTIRNKNYFYKIINKSLKDIFIRQNIKKIIVEFFLFLCIYISIFFILLILVGIPVHGKIEYDYNRWSPELKKEDLINSKELKPFNFLYENESGEESITYLIINNKSLDCQSGELYSFIIKSDYGFKSSNIRKKPKNDIYILNSNISRLHTYKVKKQTFFTKWFYSPKYMEKTIYVFEVPESGINKNN